MCHGMGRRDLSILKRQIVRMGVNLSDVDTPVRIQRDDKPLNSDLAVSTLRENLC